jgi:ribosomal protein S18 acetylase RimI-like enzyme
LSTQFKQPERVLVTTRPVQPDDEPFLFELYSSTRREEIAAFGWDSAQADMFLRLQFRGQQRHYQTQAFEVDYRIITFEEKSIGRLIVIRSPREIRLADISLLPEHRGGGIGACLIRGLFAEARKKNLPVTLHVDKTNRAARLYERLGFKTVADTGAHLKMEWQS